MNDRVGVDFAEVEAALARAQRAELEHLLEELPHETSVVADQCSVTASPVIGISAPSASASAGTISD